MAAPAPNKKYKSERAVGGYIARNGYEGAPGDMSWLPNVLGQPDGAPHDYNKIGTGTNARATDNCLENPTMVVGKYYVNNWELLQSQPELMKYVYKQGDSIMSKGLYFITDDGIICEPTDDFKSFIDNFLLKAMRRAFLWFMCFGYVVWFKTYAHGREVCYVPDPGQVKLQHLYDKKTQAPRVTLEWREDNAESQLYYYEGGAFAITREFQCSPMDAVGPLIDQLNQMKQARILMFDNIARPQVAVQDVVRRSGAGDINADAPNDINTVSRYMLQNAEIAGHDDQNFNRVQDMREKNAQAARELGARDTYASIPPHIRNEIALAEPISNRFVTIPSGMQAVNINTTVHDLDYTANYQLIVSMLDQLMGAEPQPAEGGAGGSAGGKSAQPPGGGGGGKIDGDTAYKWKDLLSNFATSVIKTLYNPESFRLFDPRQTWEEEKELNNERKKMGLGDLFKDPIKDAQDGIKSKKRTRFEDAEDSEDAVTLGEMLKRDNIGVRAILVTHLLADRDMSAGLMKQGGMSKDKYETIHPPPPQPEKLKTIKKKK
jgi:hypothetical protein